MENGRRKLLFKVLLRLVLIQDEQEEIDTIIWTVSGKVKEVRRPLASSRKNLTFDYSLSRWRATESGMLWDRE